MLHAQLSGLCRDATDNTAPRHKILIFEQDEFLASLLNLLLMREGYSISAITSPEDAQAHILSKSPADLIFIDNRWLEEDRPIILQALENNPAWQSVPVIMLLNYFNDDVIEHALENGVSDYLVQPFQPGDLIEKIIRHINTD